MSLRAYLRNTAGFVGCAGWLVAAAQADPPVSQTPPPAATTRQASSTRPLVRALARDVGEWARLLSTVPQLALYAGEFSIFPASAAKTAIERGGRTRDAITTWTFVDGPFEWMPSSANKFWVVAGAAGPRVVIAVFEPGDKPKHVASTVLLEPEPALAIGWSASEPNRLLWTTCYGCQGLGGSIEASAAGRVAFVYR
jgi:hypothetical protein